MNNRSRQRPASLRHVWMLLLFTIFPAVLALRTRRLSVVGPLSIDPFSSATTVDPIAFLGSVPRGGADATKGTTTAAAAADDEDSKDDDEGLDETEEEETAEEPGLEESDAVFEDAVEEVVEVAVEAAEIEEEFEEDVVVEEVVAEDVDIVAEEVDEEEEEVVFPTDEIPSDDVRSFHTTDGELADDEGMYTDGQNESPIAENEAASETIGAAEELGDDNDDDDDADDDVVVVEKPEPTSEEATTAVRTAASVAVIDDALKEVLMTDLHYTKNDVSRMRPEIAVDVVRNQLSRPLEGMPKNWYSDPEDFAKSSLLAKKKGLVVSIVAVGAAALTVGFLKENDAVGDTIEDIADALRAIPKSLVAIMAAAKKSVAGKTKPAAATAAAAAPAVAPESETKEEVQEEDEKEDGPGAMDTSIHSIKPGTSPEEVPDPEVDYTWLDKLITRIGRTLNSIFNAKI